MDHAASGNAGDDRHLAWADLWHIRFNPYIQRKV